MGCPERQPAGFPWGGTRSHFAKVGFWGWITVFWWKDKPVCPPSWWSQHCLILQGLRDPGPCFPAASPGLVPVCGSGPEGDKVTRRFPAIT